MASSSMTPEDRQRRQAAFLARADRLGPLPTGALAWGHAPGEPDAAAAPSDESLQVARRVFGSVPGEDVAHAQDRTVRVARCLDKLVAANRRRRTAREVTAARRA